MPRFFNRIRKQLAKENKFFQYSRYAIGEILLVVIGILIALQVDSWKEERKTRLTEKEILVSLKGEFNQNLKKVEEVFKEADSVAKNSVYLGNLINKGLSEADTLKISRLLYNSLFHSPSIKLSTGVLNDVINSGKLNIIQNDSIRTHLASFQSEKEKLEQQEEFMRNLNSKLVEIQLDYGNFRKHRFFLNPSDKDDFGIDPSTRPFNFDYIKEISFENHLEMYHAAITAYRQLGLKELKEYLISTNTLINKELDD